MIPIYDNHKSMIQILPTPYQPKQGEAYNDTAILFLKKADFGKVEQIPGRIMISFQFCLFKKLIIQNDEEIPLEDVSISFDNCIIRDLEVIKINGENISIHLGASIISGRIAAEKLLSVSINNCLLNTSLFILGIKNIRISYTTENIFPYWWTQLFKITKADFKWYAHNEQRYHIENPKKLVITSSRKSSDPTGYHLMEYNTERIYQIGYRLFKAQEALLKIAVNISYTDGKDASTLIENVDLRSLSLTGNSNGKLAVENTTISNWYLSEFSPKEEAGFYNIIPRSSDEDTKISIHKCNLDKAWFDNVYFEDFDLLSFYRSKFSGVTFTSCSFPASYSKFAKFTPIANVHAPLEKPDNYEKDQYEIFLQLKKALEATGNGYESLKLQAVSQTALSKITAISAGDRFILGTSDISNEHGQSIGRPLLWFGFISVVGYIVYLSSVGRIFQPTDFDANLIGYYFSFIDLTHRSDFLVDKKEINGLALAIDYIIKVILGYLIVQFIAAFRKYARK